MHYGLLLKTLLVLLLSLIVYTVVMGIVVVLWSTESTMSSDILSYPLATLSTNVVFGIWVRYMWRKNNDGTYAEQARLRWVFVALLVFEVLVTIIVTALMFYKEFR
jgi:hypothetical protein